MFGGKPMFDYVSYAKELRHELHQCPEIGFDLKETLVIVRRELDAMGISYTEKYGKSSIVATINEGKMPRIGLRADMDALPIEEKSENPFPSKNPGQMHACGHDAHTANLLAVARKLNDMKDSLRCSVKLLFTPAEEYSTPGAELMVKDGVLGERKLTEEVNNHIHTKYSFSPRCTCCAATPGLLIFCKP